MAVRATKRLTVHRPPPILTIHLKRFDDITHNKLHKQFKYPDRFDFAPFVTSHSRWATGSGRLLYQLYAVINHHGNNTHSGHYTACVKSLRAGSGRWYLCDDSKVAPCGQSQYLHNYHTAYMLFYMRTQRPVACVQPSSQPQSKLIVNGSPSVGSPNKSLTGATGRPIFAAADAGRGVLQHTTRPPIGQSTPTTTPQKITHRVQPLLKPNQVPLLVGRTSGHAHAHASHSQAAVAPKPPEVGGAPVAKRKLVPYLSDDDEADDGEPASTQTASADAAPKQSSLPSDHTSASSSSLYSGLPPPHQQQQADATGEVGPPATDSNEQKPANDDVQGSADTSSASQVATVAPAVHKPIKLKIKRISSENLAKANQCAGDDDTSATSMLSSSFDTPTVLKKKKKKLKNKFKLVSSEEPASADTTGIKSDEPTNATASQKTLEQNGVDELIKPKAEDQQPVEKTTLKVPDVKAAVESARLTGPSEEDRVAEKVEFVKRHHVRDRKAHLRTSADAADEEEAASPEREPSDAEAGRPKGRKRKQRPDEPSAGAEVRLIDGRQHIITPFEPPADVTTRWGEDRIAKWSSGQSCGTKRPRSHSPSEGGGGHRWSPAGRSDQCDGHEERRRGRRDRSGDSSRGPDDGHRKANPFQRLQDERNVRFSTLYPCAAAQRPRASQQAGHGGDRWRHREHARSQQQQHRWRHDDRYDRHRSATGDHRSKHRHHSHGHKRPHAD